MVKIREEQLGSINILDDDLSGIVNSNDSRIINVSTPLSDTDVANKAYVDNTHSTLLQVLMVDNNADGYSILNINYLTAVDGLFTNNIYIDGYSQQTGLMIEHQNSVPGGIPPIGYTTIWSKNSDGYIYSTDSNGVETMLSNILDPEFYQFFLLLDGTRAMTGDLDMNGNNISNIINLAAVDGYFANDLTVGNSITAVDGYFSHLYLLDNFLVASDLDGYIKINAVNTDNLSTTENNTGKLLSPDGIGGVTWITPPSLDGYLTMENLDGYITGVALDGYIKVEAVTTDNLSTIENDTGKLLAPNGIGGVTWITPPSLDGYLTMENLDGYITGVALDGYIKVEAVTTDNLSTIENNTGKLLSPDGIGGVTWITPPSLDGYLTMENLDGYITGVALDGYIKIDAVNTENLSTTENNTGKLLSPDGIGGVTWITPPSLDGYLTMENLDGYITGVALDGYIKIDAVNTENLSTTENNTGKLLSPDGIGGVTWITPPSLDGYLSSSVLDGYLTVTALDGYIKIDAVNTENLSTIENDTGKLLAPNGIGGVTWITPPSLDGYLTIQDLDGYITGSALDGYIKVDSVTTNNLTTTEYNDFLVLRPDGVGGVKWSNDGYLITPDSVTDTAVVRWNYTDGYRYSLQNSNVIINNTNDIGGINIISSSYFTTTANYATFNFGSNDIVIGDGFIKASGSTLQTYIGNSSELTLNGAALYPSTDNGLNSGQSSYRWNTIYGTSLDLNGTISGATTIDSSYFTTTAKEATFNFGSNDVVIGDGYIKASGSSLQTYIGNTSELTLTNDTFRPTTDGGLNLGDDNYYFESLHAQMGVFSLVINPITDGNADIGLSDRRWNNIFCYSLDCSNYLYVNGSIDLNGTLEGATTISSSNFTTTANDATFNFGSNDIVIGDGYIKASGSTLQTYIGNTSELTLTNDTLRPSTNGTLTLGDGSYGFSGARFYNPSGCAITLKADTNTNSYINFGDTDAIDSGRIIYYNSTNLFEFRVNDFNCAKLTSNAFLPHAGGLNLGVAGTNSWNTIYCKSHMVDTRDLFYDSKLYILTTDGYGSILYFGDTSNTAIGAIHYNHSSNYLSFKVNNAFELGLSSTALYPITNNGLTLGDSSYRWSEVFATNGTINTSDERQKQDILPIDDDVLTAWGDVSLVFFRWIDAVNEKGDDARIHSGFISQRIRDAFAAHGLDAHRYGLFCYDQWEEQVDNEGNVIQSAGDSYGIRITECLAVEAAYQRRRADQIEERLTTIEKLLNI